jgi:predicted ATPase/DNA-binding winged helix-turn-helix (wHTH) protein
MSSTVRFGDVVFRIDQRRIDRGGEPVKLGARAIDVLAVLVTQRDRVVPKSELLDLAWAGLVVEENNLQVQVSAIRRSLGNDVISTVPGRGYQFAARLLDDVPPEPGSASPPSLEGGVDRTRTGRASGGVSVGGDRAFGGPSTLIGRTSDIERTLVALNVFRVVTLTGPGGIGKTSVAQHVADLSASAGNPAGRVFWARLADARDQGAVALFAAGAMGVTVGLERSPTEAIGATLGDVDTLVVLDGCEHVIDAVAALVEAVRPSARATRWLLTSQEPLRIEGEHVLRLEGLTVIASPGGVSPAVQLFERVSLACDPRIRYDDAARQEIAHICAALDGIPLAIELAAARAPLLGLPLLAQRLHERLHLLGSNRRNVAPQQRSLRAALEWSHALLNPVEQTVLRRLGAFVGGFSLDLAQRVVADESLNAWEVIDALAMLVDKSWVVLRSGQDLRYGLLESTRLFALERLEAAGETDVIRLRSARAHEQLLGAQFAHRWQPSPTDIRTGLAELDNLRNTLGWLTRDGAPEEQRQLAISLMGLSARIWHHGGLLREGCAWCEHLLPLPPSTPLAARAAFHLAHASLGFTGPSKACQAAATHAVAFCREAGSPRLGEALVLQALIGAYVGDVEGTDLALAEARASVPPDAPLRLRATLLLAAQPWPSFQQDAKRRDSLQRWNKPGSTAAPEMPSPSGSPM